MAVRYSETKEFTKAQLSELYSLAGHPFADDPALLKAAAAGSSRVISAWEGRRLLALIRALDDGAMTVCVCELVALPQSEAQEAAQELKKRLIEACAGRMRIIGMPENT